jgi:hypothetical protein
MTNTRRAAKKRKYAYFAQLKKKVENFQKFLPDTKACHMRPLHVNYNRSAHWFMKSDSCAKSEICL